MKTHLMILFKQADFINVKSARFYCIILLFSFLLSCNDKQNKVGPSDSQDKLAQLQISDNGRFLVTKSGDPVFLNGDTAWMVHYKLDTNQVDYYFNKRKEQKFNSIAISALRTKDSWSNVYGDEPFQREADSLFDPLAPIITPEYDFWDHLDNVIDKAEEMGFYVILLPSWGTQVAGSWDGSDTSGIIFNEDNGYEYGRWLGDRYREKEHIIWMIGGDVSAVHGEDRDYRDVFRAIAKGVADGVNGEDNENGITDYSTLLQSYHPRKYAPNSSEWFHNDEWLDFNSVQEWPEDAIPAIVNDYQLEPVKPTWLFEGRYEGYKEEWKDWQVRYQAYQSVFAGGFGHMYGHESLIGNFTPGWETELDDPGARQMQHLYALMTSMDDDQFLNRVPNQDLIDGDDGTAERLSSTKIQATQGSDGSYAFIYSANGTDIPVKMELLADTATDAYWYNPRNGMWHVDGKEFTEAKPFEDNLNSGPGASSITFDPPGSPEIENDWILVLK